MHATLFKFLFSKIFSSFWLHPYSLEAQSINKPLLVQWQQKTPLEALCCCPEAWRRSTSVVSPAACLHSRRPTRSPHWLQTLTLSGSSHTCPHRHTVTRLTANPHKHWQAPRLPGHGLDYGGKAQRYFLFPLEDLVEVLQGDNHRAALSAAPGDKSCPEVHFTVPVRGVHVSVLLEIREHKVHPLVVIPFRWQAHFCTGRHL